MIRNNKQYKFMITDEEYLSNSEIRVQSLSSKLVMPCGMLTF